ncbi:DUF433 domain-containing protein [Flavobacterium tructae]|uniref:DUF433 domain-containing protein n=1 Tax=Flavobacterium tructae TaxID=1114873 RepID=UPI002551E8B4|nr:DUF433 domain-containing protein [Flavobacterium tructae]MDL2143023.1 DUF433 domain-containing protein [Flavobacterium tructae]
MENNWQNLISIDPDIRFGKPVIAGTRICVSDILSWLSTAMTFEEIIADFPELKKEHILAALAFDANRENITNQIL